MFRRHIGGSSQHHSGLRQQHRRLSFSVNRNLATHNFRQAEVEYFHFAARRDDDIRRLNVAMDDAVRVGFSQCIGHLHSDRKRLREIEGLALHSDIERLAFNVLHHDEAAIILFADFIDRADVRMV